MINSQFVFTSVRISFISSSVTASSLLPYPQAASGRLRHHRKSRCCTFASSDFFRAGNEACQISCRSPQRAKHPLGERTSPTNGRDTTACLQVVSKCALARERAWENLRRGSPIAESMLSIVGSMLLSVVLSLVVPIFVGWPAFIMSFRSLLFLSNNL